MLASAYDVLILFFTPCLSSTSLVLLGLADFQGLLQQWRKVYVATCRSACMWKVPIKQLATVITS